MRLDGFVLLLGLFPLIPGLKGDEEKCVVSALDLAEQTEADHGRRILDARGLLQNSLDLLAEIICSIERGSERKLGVDKDIALIFLRQKGRRKLFAQAQRDRSNR